jgi:hypothetical protein
MAIVVVVGKVIEERCCYARKKKRRRGKQVNEYFVVKAQSGMADGANGADESSLRGT